MCRMTTHYAALMEKPKELNSRVRVTNGDKKDSNNIARCAYAAEKSDTVRVTDDALQRTLSLIGCPDLDTYRMGRRCRLRLELAAAAGARLDARILSYP